jgi:hypothetical protein
MNLMQLLSPGRITGLMLFCLAGLLVQPGNISTALAAESQLRDCSSKTVSSPNSVQCEVDVFDGQLVSRVAVTSVPGNQPVSARYVLNGPEESPTIVGVLWGVSSELEPVDFNRLKAVISATLNLNVSHISYGLWTYATDVRTIAPLGTSPATIKLALEGIRPAGKTSELLRGINEVAKSIVASPVRRKVLIVLSDGIFDDTAYTIPELSDKLKGANVRVFVVIPSRAPEAITAAQGLRRLADETKGVFLSAYNQESTQKVAQAIKAHIEGSGSITFDVPANPVRIDVFLTNNKILSGTFEPPVRPPAPDNSARPATDNQPAEVAPPAETSSASLYRRLNGIVGWASETSLRLALVAAGASALVAALAGLWIWRRRSNARRKQLMIDKSKGQQGNTVSDMRPILGWLEFFDTGETKEPIRTQVTRIGRQKDNDLVIQNSTVHRHHALLKQELSGAFSIMDLDTKNGVLVNGEQVKSGKLSDGDTVELGEVRMRFRMS